MPEKSSSLQPERGSQVEIVDIYNCELVRPKEFVKAWKQLRRDSLSYVELFHSRVPLTVEIYRGERGRGRRGGGGGEGQGGPPRRAA